MSVSPSHSELTVLPHQKDKNCYFHGLKLDPLK